MGTLIYIYGLGHMTKMTAMLIYGQNLLTRSPMILKPGNGPSGLKVYKIYINEYLGLMLTYFTARSNFVKIAYCTYTRPRCQVSIIGPLVSL